MCFITVVLSKFIPICANIECYYYYERSLWVYIYYNLTIPTLYINLFLPVLIYNFVLNEILFSISLSSLSSCYIIGPIRTANANYFILLNV